MKPALMALALLITLTSVPAQAQFFNLLNELKTKITDGQNKADANSDAAYEAEMLKKYPPYAFAEPAAGQAGTYVELERGANFKDIKKLGIINFSVEFALFKEVQASGGSQYAGGTARSAEKAMEIPAPDVARLQAMVNALYANTVKDFADMGVEVVPFETLKATKNYGELAPAQHASPWLTSTKDSQSVFMAPTGMQLYMDNPNRADFLQGLGFTFGTNTRMKEVMMTYDLKQEVHLLSVNMVVDFAAMKTSGRSFISYASVGGANLHHLHAGDTSYRFVSTTQPEFLYARLRTPLVSDVALVARTTQSTQRASTQAMAGSGMAVETTTTNTATRGDNAFDMETYYRRSADMMNATRQMFALELGKVRR